MDEFGESPSFYIWPTDHEEGEPFPDDFYRRVNKALRDAGFECETV
mgnify:CR=1 FL=1